jgi:phosphoenolpyruvate synthase/pyruvate phosphate dikinase
MRITEKTITAQEYMMVKKGRSVSNEDPNIKVDISPEWQKKQKLPDHLMIQVAKITKMLKDKYEEPVEVHFAVETGNLYILSKFKQEFLNLDTRLDILLVKKYLVI